MTMANIASSRQSIRHPRSVPGIQGRRTVIVLLACAIAAIVLAENILEGG
jgi:hypothetical protein